MTPRPATRADRAATRRSMAASSARSASREGELCIHSTSRGLCSRAAVCCNLMATCAQCAQVQPVRRHARLRGDPARQLLRGREAAAAALPPRVNRAARRDELLHLLRWYVRRRIPFRVPCLSRARSVAMVLLRSRGWLVSVCCSVFTASLALTHIHLLLKFDTRPRFVPSCSATGGLGQPEPALSVPGRLLQRTARAPRAERLRAVRVLPLSFTC